MDNKITEYKKHFSPSKGGWYRVAKFGPYPNLSTAKGGSGNSLKFAIKSYFNESGNMTVFGILNSSHYKSNIVILGESIGTFTISKIRHTVDTSNDTAYLEFYYNVNARNGLQIEIESVSSFDYKWQLLNELEETIEFDSKVEILSISDLITKDRNIITNSDLYTKIVDANFVNGEVSITINDIDVTKYSWSAVGRTGMTIITSILPENTNTLKLTARGWWDSTVSEGATRNIQLIGVKISS